MAALLNSGSSDVPVCVGRSTTNEVDWLETTNCLVEYGSRLLLSKRLVLLG